MKTLPRRLSGLISVTTALVMASACGPAPDADHAAMGDAAPAAGMEAGASAEEMATLRQLTAGFGDTAVARAAGYTDRITSCWYHRELGGQGYHFARSEWIDGTVSLHEPELVMYEPLADGTLQFLAIEYIVPFGAWDQPDPPTLLNRTFMRNERLELYVLHVWLGKHNPSGMYADWNPDVSCAHADESEDRA